MTVDRDWVISPGEIIKDWLEENRCSVRVLATACGRMDPERLQKLVDGKVKLNSDDAVRLYAGTGISSVFWIKLERAFRQGLAEGKCWTP